MTENADGAHLAAIAREAQAEIEAAEMLEVAEVAPDGAAPAMNVAELSYYEAELKSLRDAARTLDEAEQKPD